MEPRRKRTVRLNDNGLLSLLSASRLDFVRALGLSWLMSALLAVSAAEDA